MLKCTRKTEDKLRKVLTGVIIAILLILLLLFFVYNPAILLQILAIGAFISSVWIIISWPLP